MPAGLNVVILAAGQGKRMRSRLPKVLHPLAGRPLIAHVVAAARALKPAAHLRGLWPRRRAGAAGAQGERPDFRQAAAPARHRARAAQALPHLGTAGLTLVLYGDVPLIGEETLAAMIAGGGDRLTLLTAELDDPAGYGRIVRNRRGSITAIVEEKDASAEQRKIREINTGIMALPTARLQDWMSRLTNRNAQREYYLTDVVPLALADRVAVATVKARAAWEILGVNSKQQLAQLERIYQRQQATRLMEAGVTLADPARIDVRGSLACGADVQHRRELRVRGRRQARRPGRDRRQLRAEEYRGRRGHAHRAVYLYRRGQDRRELPHRALRAFPSGGPAGRGGAHRQLRRGESNPTSARAPRRIISPISATPPSAATSTSAPAPSPATTTAPTSTGP